MLHAAEPSPLARPAGAGDSTMATTDPGAFVPVCVRTKKSVLTSLARRRPRLPTTSEGRDGAVDTYQGACTIRDARRRFALVFVDHDWPRERA